MPRDKDGLFRHSILLFAATQVANACNLLFHVVMGRGLPGEEYTILTALLNVMMIVATPLDALRTAVAHFAARVMQEGHGLSLRRLIRELTLRLCVIAVPLGLLMVLFARPLSAYFHTDRIMPVVITGLTIPAVMYLPIVTGALQGLQAFLWMAGAFQIVSVVRLGLGVVLMLWFARTAMAGIGAQWIAFYAAVAVGVYAMAKLLHNKGPDQTSTRGVGAYFFKSLAILASYAVLTMIDVILVRHYLPGESVFFTQAATISRTIIFLPMPIAFAMFPKVVSTGGLTGETRKTFLKALGLVMFIVLGGTLGCTLLPHIPLQLMYGQKAPESMELVRKVIWAMTPYGFTYLLMNFELAQHRFSAAIPMMLCAAAYVGGVALFHDSLNQVITVMACVSTASAVTYLWLGPWRHPRHAKA